MAKVSIGMSCTINYESNSIQFAKIDARIDELDLEEEVDGQLGNFDEVVDKAFAKLKKTIVERIRKKSK